MLLLQKKIHNFFLYLWKYKVSLKYPNSDMTVSPTSWRLEEIRLLNITILFGKCSKPPPTLQSTLGICPFCNSKQNSSNKFWSRFDKVTTGYYRHSRYNRYNLWAFKHFHVLAHLFETQFIMRSELSGEFTEALATFGFWFIFFYFAFYIYQSHYAFIKIVFLFCPG